MFTVTSLFERFGGYFEQLAGQIPLEYAAHSHSHDPYNAAGRDEVENSALVMKRINGGGPLGYRAPIGRITQEGLGHLLDSGYQYDASLYTSFRPGKFGYRNLDKPNVPFRVRRGGESLIEFPFTSLSKARVVFSLSYIKLLGWDLYSSLWKIFGLPEITLALSHPHDFYFHELAGFHPVGAERLALARNARRAFDYFDKMLTELRRQGYELAFVSEALAYVQSLSGLQEIALNDWK
jgi:peptidoglycan/xylan/chitin deacetylase (PgdA/CDA1 family)